MQASTSTSGKKSTSVILKSTTKSTKINTNVDPNSEIEEISKKISEHADAIYRTWKCRGLAPTELLDFYTNATAAETTGDFFVDDPSATSTEGLQKLVNTFVIKDKEQRGVKQNNINNNSTSGSSISSSSSSNNSSTKSKSSILKSTNTEETAMKISNHLTATTSKMTSKSKSATGLTPAPSTATLLTQNTAANDEVDTLLNKKKSTAKAVATPATTKSTTVSTVPIVKNNACVKIVETTAEQPNEKHKKVAEKIGNVVGASGVTKSKIITNPTTHGINAVNSNSPNTKPLELNFDFDLNLDVKNLTEIQTQNLLKIKELLQENAEPTKITKKTNKTSNATTPTPTLLATATGTGTGVGTGTGSSATNKANSKTIAKAATNSPALTTIVTDKEKVNNKKNVKNDSSNIVAADTISVTTRASNVINKKTNDVAKKSSSSAVTTKVTSTKLMPSSIASAVSSASALAAVTALEQTSPAAAAAASSTKTTTATTATTATTPTDNKKPQRDQQQQQISTKTKGDDKATKSTNKLIKSVTAKSAAIVENNKNINNNTQIINNSKGTATPTATTVLKTEKDNKISVANSLETENVMEVARANMPAPTKAKTTTRSLTNGLDKNSGRPILTRGSVAERVLMFEKCPDVRNMNLNIKRPNPADTSPKLLVKVKLHATPPSPQEHNSLQKEIRSTKSVYIPRFYFPHGKPQPTIALERTLRSFISAFDSYPNNQVTKDELPRILKLCGLPFYWRMPVLLFCQQGNSGLVERQRFVEFWKQMNVYCHDAASRFVYILSRGQRFRSYILPEDLAPLVQDVVDTHPGLAFLKEAIEFHSRYVHTVIARIFYTVNRSWSGKISISELKKSDLLEIISLLEEEDDINQIMAFFSYEHFYVIYCKFWELDKDHDLLISQDDLARHSDHALSTRIVERIFSGCVTRSDNKKNEDDEPKMSYTDFVWFLLSEEDKRTPTAIEYWFRVMDIDGDGILSMYELEYFYEEQQQRMESIGIETLPFEDCLCQMLDMIKPQRRDAITLSDLKRCKMTHIFFDTFFNLEKYLDHEQRDPFASQRDEYTSDWDRYAAQEYELLVTEENE